MCEFHIRYGEAFNIVTPLSVLLLSLNFCKHTIRTHLAYIANVKILLYETTKSQF